MSKDQRKANRQQLAVQNDISIRGSSSFHFSPAVTLALACAWIGYALLFIIPTRLAANLPYFRTIDVAEFFSGIANVEWRTNAKSLGSVLLIFGAASSGGIRFLQKLKIVGLSKAEQVLFGLGIGLGILSLSCLGAGLAHALSPIMLWIGVVAFGLFGLIGRIVSPPYQFRPVARSEMDGIQAAAFALICFIALVNLIGALGPPIFYDTLVYHLALPKLYLIKGGIVPTPENIYAGIPANTEMLYLLGLALAGEGTAKLIPWALSITLAAAILLWVRRHSDTRLGIIAALLFYSCPMVAFQTWSSLIELTWALYAFLAFYCLSLLEDNSEFQENCVVLGGIFAGLAAGVKYNALPLIIIAPLSRLLWQRKEASERQRICRQSIVFIGVACIVASPWLLKNMWFYRNPLFPLFDGFLGKSFGADWRALLSDAQTRSLWSIPTLHGITDMVTVLWSSTWENTVIHMIGPALLLFVPLSLLVKWQNPGYRPLAIFAALCYFSWSISSRLPRFILFAVPAAAILAVRATLSFEPGRRSGHLFEASLLFVCLLNAMQITCYWHQWGAWRVVLGQQTRSAYLLQGRPGYFTPYFAAAEFTNRSLPLGAKIFLFGESRSYFFDHEVVATSFFGRDPFVTAVNEARTPAEVSQFLKRKGITHFAVSRAELYRRGSTSPFESGASEIFSRFVQMHLRLIFKHIVTSPPDDRQWIEVYEVV